MQNKIQKKPKSLVGVVVSDKMDKTAVVRLQSIGFHKLYKKIIRQKSKIKVHDEKNQAKTGDKVRVIQTRPLSKGKRYKIAEVIKGK